MHADRARDGNASVDIAIANRDRRSRAHTVRPWGRVSADQMLRRWLSVMD